MAILRWTVQFAVDSSWVAEGFDLTDARAKDMLANDLRYASGCELGAKVLKSPNPVRIARLQGYASKRLAYGIKLVQDRRKADKL